MYGEEPGVGFMPQSLCVKFDVDCMSSSEFEWRLYMYRTSSELHVRPPITLLPIGLNCNTVLIYV